MVKAEILMVKEEIITKENAVKAVAKVVAKAVAKDVVKAVAMNSIMKKDMDSTVAHPIAIGTMC